MVASLLTLEGDEIILSADVDIFRVGSVEFGGGSAEFEFDYVVDVEFFPLSSNVDEQVITIDIFQDGFIESMEVFEIEYGNNNSIHREVIIQDYPGQFADTFLSRPDNTTGVVAGSYQFFTGRIPGADGFIYLINSVRNPADLMDPYYAGFNQENRYLNFAANLGLQGEGRATFQAEYARLSYEQTVRKAYDEIVGFDEAIAAGNTEADIMDFFSDARPFYEAVARERVLPGTPGLSLEQATKVVAIGSILNEGIKADFGRYAEAYDNFLVDLLDGQAQFQVNLLATYDDPLLL